MSERIPQNYSGEVKKAQIQTEGVNNDNDSSNAEVSESIHTNTQRISLKDFALRPFSAQEVPSKVDYVQLVVTHFSAALIDAGYDQAEVDSLIKKSLDTIDFTKSAEVFVADINRIIKNFYKSAPNTQIPEIIPVDTRRYKLDELKKFVDRPVTAEAIKATPDLFNKVEQKLKAALIAAGYDTTEIEEIFLQSYKKINQTSSPELIAADINRITRNLYLQIKDKYFNEYAVTGGRAIPEYNALVSNGVSLPHEAAPNFISKRDLTTVPNFEDNSKVTEVAIGNTDNSPHAADSSELPSVQASQSNLDTLVLSDPVRKNVSEISEELESSESPKPLKLVDSMRVRETYFTSPETNPAQTLELETATVDKINDASFVSESKNENTEHQSEIIPDSHELENDEIEAVDLSTKESRDTYYSDVQQQVAAVVMQAAEHLRKFDASKDNTEAWSNKNVYHPHREGLQAASNVRLFFTNTFTKYFSTLEELIKTEPKNPTVEQKIAQYTQYVNTWYEKIQDEIEKVNQALTLVLGLSDAGPQQSSEVEVEGEALVLAEPTIVEPEKSKALESFEPVDTNNVLKRVTSTLDRINYSIATEDPDREEIRELIKVKSYLIELHGLIQQRSREPDSLVRSKNQVRTMKFVSKDIQKAELLLSQLEHSKNVPVEIVIPLEREVSVSEETLNPPSAVETSVESLSETLPETKQKENLPTSQSRALVVMTERQNELRKNTPAAILELVKSLTPYFYSPKVNKVGKLAILLSAIAWPTPVAENGKVSTFPLRIEAEADSVRNLTTAQTNLEASDIKDYFRTVIPSLNPPISSQYVSDVKPVIPTFEPSDLKNQFDSNAQVPTFTAEALESFTPGEKTELTTVAKNETQPFIDSVPAYQNPESNTMPDIEHTLTQGNVLWKIIKGETDAPPLPVMTEINPKLWDSVADVVRDRINTSYELQQSIGGFDSSKDIPADNLIVGKSMNLTELEALVRRVAQDCGYL